MDALIDASIDAFVSLPPERMKAAHLLLCEGALRKWEAYITQAGPISYAETVCGTLQTVDAGLPGAALRCARAGADAEGVGQRYREPIVALQDCDLVLPDAVKFAYYSIYNLFCKYAAGERVDDWLIANQALAAEECESEWPGLLESATRQAL